MWKYQWNALAQSLSPNVSHADYEPSEPEAGEKSRYLAVMKSPGDNFRCPRPGLEGFIVVVVLWLLGALSILASIYSVYVVNTAAAALPVTTNQLRAEALVSAALELTAYKQLTQQPRPTSGQFSFRLGQANIAVKFRSEASTN